MTPVNKPKKALREALQKKKEQLESKGDEYVPMASQSELEVRHGQQRLFER